MKKCEHCGALNEKSYKGVCPSCPDHKFPVKYKEFNINWEVMVKLAETGRRELERQHREFYAEYPSIRKYVPRKEDEDGWSRWQLYDLMNSLGHMCTMGCVLPFETVIRIQEKK